MRKRLQNKSPAYFKCHKISFKLARFESYFVYGRQNKNKIFKSTRFCWFGNANLRCTYKRESERKCLKLSKTNCGSYLELAK